ncbi:MAG TPA: RES domain-containing protein [Solirubrobacteraceae bacterium]
MIVWRLLPWQPGASPRSPGGALWFPRELQGAGRHDNPDRYGCLYVSETPVSVVVEGLASFRGAPTLTNGMLTRAGVRLALAQLELHDDGQLVDLDNPRTLIDTELRPSEVATGIRSVTQSYVLRLLDAQPGLLGLRWWSTIEASLINLTLFDRAQHELSVIDVTPLTVADVVVREGADLLGLATY